jgi:hypothetical protein
MDRVCPPDPPRRVATAQFHFKSRPIRPTITVAFHMLDVDAMHLIRCVLISFGIILSIFAAMAVYTVFYRPDAGPRIIADATIAVLMAILCFVGSARIVHKKLD